MGDQSSNTKAAEAEAAGAVIGEGFAFFRWHSLKWKTIRDCTGMDDPTCPGFHMWHVERLR